MLTKLLKSYLTHKVKFWTVSMWNYIGMTAPDYYQLNNFSQQLSSLGPTLTTLPLNRPFPPFHTLPSYVKASSLSSLSTLPNTRCKTNNFSSTPLFWVNKTLQGNFITLKPTLKVHKKI
jgi:hypothetical protein